MFQIPDGKPNGLFFSLSLVCLAVLTVLVTLTLLIVMLMVVTGGERGQEEDMLIGEEEDIGLLQTNEFYHEPHKKFNLKFSTVSTICNILSVNCNKNCFQDRYITVDK